MDRDAIGGYWLLFTCIESAMPPRQIHAVRVSRALEIVQEGAARISFDGFSTSHIRDPAQEVHRGIAPDFRRFHTVFR